MTDPRIDQLRLPHMRQIMELVDAWRAAGLDVPNPDPNDGGVNAKVLVLLESPGPRAVGTGFISRDNPDPSARNLGRLLDEAGIERAEVLIWNAVPFSVSTVDENRNASPMQVRKAAPLTQALINQLPSLSAIVFCGRRAQQARQYLMISGQVFETFHPGAMSYNQARCREHMHATFAAVRAHLDGGN